jgi:CO dehydrogenase maturation factor
MKVIAVSGKGGTGKTTITALIIRWLSLNRAGPVLAVDADPCAGLGDTLGVEVRETVGAIREEMKTRVTGLPGGMSKQQFLEYKIQAGLIETPDFDLVVMGRPEGPGCYCYANNLLRDILDALSKNYRYVVIDNEAGMEHMSRRTVFSIDHLFMVSDPTVKGVGVAGKVSRLADELGLRLDRRHLVLNRVDQSPPDAVRAAIERERLIEVCVIPEDDRVLSLDQTGRPAWPELHETRAYRAFGACLGNLLTDLEEEDGR